MIKKYLTIVCFLFFGINAFAQNFDINIVGSSIVCNPGDCANLQVNYPNLKETTSYQVSSIPYIPPFAATAGNATSLSMDDSWSNAIDLKGNGVQDFNFCFYGQTYKKVLISTNGAITFSVAGETPGGFYTPGSFSTWVMSGPIPYAANASQAPFRNSINGVFQDSNPAVINSFANPNINYYTAGTYPNRVFVVNFSQIAQYACSSDAGVGAQTSQIVLFESSNKIEVYIKRRVPCTTWNSGNGVVGIQNQDGTIGTVPSARNVGSWSATNEAWRFTPNGNTITPGISWMHNGNVIGNSSTINVCPLATEQYTAIVSYPVCNSTGTTDLSDSITVNLASTMLQEPTDLQACSSSFNPIAFDLTLNAPIVLGSLNPGDYMLSYHVSLSDANNGINAITTPQSFLTVGNQTVFVRIESLVSGCVSIKSFDLIVNSIPSAPSGSSSQNFTAGETLADIELTGTNIQWYGSSNNYDLLPNSTVLTDGTTYFASQTNNGCESARMGVTVHNLLSIQEVNGGNFRVYPNPVKNVLNLSYTTEIASVAVYNLLGQEVLSKQLNASQAQLDMSDLSVGTYVVKVTVDGMMKTIKVVKQ